MRVILYFKNDWAEPENIFFDLHFREPSYAILHRITFYNPPMPLLGVLALEFAPSDSEPTTGTAKKRRTSPSLAKAKTLYDDTSDYKSVQDTSISTIVDDVLEEKDVDSIDPIHSAQLDEHTRRAWGVPEHIDMSKLAKRLMTLTSEQTEEVASILKNHILEENDGKFQCCEKKKNVFDRKKKTYRKVCGRSLFFGTRPDNAVMGYYREKIKVFSGFIPIFTSPS